MSPAKINSILLIFSISSLAITFLMGSIFRLQFVQLAEVAGILPDFLTHYNWRQAHTHLGFYGGIMPLTWVALNFINKNISFTKALLAIYILATALSTVGFLWDGYNRLSHIFSGIIAFIWILLAIINLNHQKGIAKTVPIAYFLSLFTLLAIVFLQGWIPNFHLQSAVHIFLTLLLLGVGLPTVLSLNGVKLSSYFWLIGTILTAFHLTTSISPLTSLGPLLLGLTLAPKLLKSKAQLWTRIALASFSISFTLFGFLSLWSLIPQPISYQMGITGLHFLILIPIIGPLLQSHFKSIIIDLFFVMSWLMIGLLGLQIFISPPLVWIHLLLGFVGLFMTALMFQLLLGLRINYEHNNN